MKAKFSIFQICMIALSVVVNIVGGQIALLLRLPIYLDSIGTIFTGAVYGPVLAMLPSLLSGLILGVTSDIYSLYYAPVGILLGLLSSLVWKKRSSKASWPFLAAFVITIPTSLCSASITAALFGGITSSGSSILVQLLAKTPLGLTMSCFIVQVMTDYLDRLLSIIIVLALLKRLPKSMLHKINPALKEDKDI